MNSIIFVHLLLIPICYAQSDSSKWVWGSRGDNFRVANSEKRYNGDLASKPLFQANSNYNGPSENLRYRYEVTEPTLSYERPTESYRPTLENNKPVYPYRPNLETNRPIYPYRPHPDFVRPTNSIDNYPTINKYNENDYRPLGNGYRPSNGDYSYQGLRPGIGTNGKPILTGPTPSWEEDPHRRYRDYDICKCVHSFNCNSPGIKFGSCDVDKQYCCYKSKQIENQGGFGKPITNIYEKPPRPRPVLAGPGGPVDYPKRPQPIRGRPPYSSYESPDRDLDEAYKQGLASAIYELQERPVHYNDRYPQRLGEQYQSDRDSFRITDDYKSIPSSKYGLYDPSASYYARSSNSSILAIDEEKN